MRGIRESIYKGGEVAKETKRAVTSDFLRCKGTKAGSCHPGDRAWLKPDIWYRVPTNHDRRIERRSVPRSHSASCRCLPMSELSRSQSSGRLHRDSCAWTTHFGSPAPWSHPQGGRRKSAASLPDLPVAPVAGMCPFQGLAQSFHLQPQPGCHRPPQGCPPTHRTPQQWGMECIPGHLARCRKAGTLKCAPVPLQW